MELWEKFCKSGRIEDYLAYAKAERNGEDDDSKRSGTERDRQR